MWLDGISVDYIFWKVNELMGLKEDCVGIEGISYGIFMFDVLCIELYSYVFRKLFEGEELFFYFFFQRFFERIFMDYILCYCMFDLESFSQSSIIDF